MEIPLVVGPVKRGREWLSSKVPVKRPDFTKIRTPRCPGCGTVLSEDIVETMEVHGIDYCPVCVLEDVHPLSNPFELSNITSQEGIKSEIMERFGPPPEEVCDESTPLPGAYILWCPPKQERTGEYLSLAEKFGNIYTKILSAATGNGLLYVGESQNVSKRIWDHSRGGAAAPTKIMLPSRVVAISWKAPGMSLQRLEREVGHQVADAVENSGYDLAVYYD